MDVLMLLIPIALLLLLIMVGLFLWSIRSGQFDDLEGPAHRILMDDDTDPAPPEADRPSSVATENGESGGREQGRGLE